MKSKLLHATWILMLTLCVVISCSEEEGPQPLEVNASAPGQVENVKVENLQGEIKLYFTKQSRSTLYCC